MEDAVVRAAEEFTDADTCLVTGDRRQDQLAAGFAEVLRRCQCRGEDHRGRVQYRAIVQVVLLDQMRAGGVDQRGKIGRATFAADQNLAAPRGWPHAPSVALEQGNRMLIPTGQGRT
ncbi:hypothetical protein D3C72_2139080 [compost metagenome]